MAMKREGLMRIFSSADAKNHFGELVDAARIAPIAVTKYDKPFVVVMSADEYERVMTLAEQTLVDRKVKSGGKK